MNNLSKKTRNSIKFNQFGFILVASIVLSSITFSCKSETSDKEKKIASDNLINLSLKHYNEGDYNGCITAAKKANEILPNSIAYNNICASYNALKEYDKAIEACNSSMKLDANNKYAKGNLAHAKKMKK